MFWLGKRQVHQCDLKKMWVTFLKTVVALWSPAYQRVVQQRTDEVVESSRTAKAYCCMWSPKAYPCDLIQQRGYWSSNSLKRWCWFRLNCVRTECIIFSCVWSCVAADHSVCPCWASPKATTAAAWYQNWARRGALKELSCVDLVFTLPDLCQASCEMFWTTNSDLWRPHLTTPWTYKCASHLHLTCSSGYTLSLSAPLTFLLCSAHFSPLFLACTMNL